MIERLKLDYFVDPGYTKNEKDIKGIKSYSYSGKLGQLAARVLSFFGVIFVWKIENGKSTYLNFSSTCRLLSRYNHETYPEKETKSKSITWIKTAIEKVERDSYEKLLKLIEENQMDQVEKILKGGFNLKKIPKDIRSPLTQAIYCKNLEMCKLLEKNGARVYSKDGNGKRPLEYGIKTNNPAIIKWLIDKGADLNKKTSDKKQTFKELLSKLCEDNPELADMYFKKERDRLAKNAICLGSYGLANLRNNLKIHSEEKAPLDNSPKVEVSKPNPELKEDNLNKEETFPIPWLLFPQTRALALLMNGGRTPKFAWKLTL